MLSRLSSVAQIVSGELALPSPCQDSQTSSEPLRVLLAEDDAMLRLELHASLEQWGYAVIACVDGAATQAALQQQPAPELLLLDRSLPDIDSLQICRQLRQQTQASVQPYIIFVTGHTANAELVAGLDAGADDYICKPFARSELKARIGVGARMLRLQRALAQRVGELEEALQQIRTLKGLLPICAYCKKIRDDGDYWHEVERYISHMSDVQFSHSVCPDCFTRHVQPQLDAL